MKPGRFEASVGWGEQREPQRSANDPGVGVRYAYPNLRREQVTSAFQLWNSKRSLG